MEDFVVMFGFFLLALVAPALVVEFRGQLTYFCVELRMVSLMALS